MASLKYYYDLMSQPSRALFIFLKLTKIPFDACPVALREGEHLTEEYKETLNRFQKVPFIHHGTFKLTESIAIVRYLSREFSERVNDNWYPQDSIEQAKVDEYLEWQHLNTRLTAAMFFQKKISDHLLHAEENLKYKRNDKSGARFYHPNTMRSSLSSLKKKRTSVRYNDLASVSSSVQEMYHKWLIPLMTGKPADPKNVATYERMLLKCINQIEELWLSQGHEYIVGKKISVADIFAACELEQTKRKSEDRTMQEWLLAEYLQSAPARVFLHQMACCYRLKEDIEEESRMAGFDCTEGRPLIKNWIEKVRRECSPYYQEAHKVVEKIAASQETKAKL